MNAWPGKHRLSLMVAVGLVVVFFLVSWRLPGGLELTVAPVKGGPPLLALPLQPGECFTIQD